MPIEFLRSVTARDVKGMKDFIRRTVGDAGCDGVVVALSGGVDSAVVSKLCADALGSENVLNIFMPTSVTPASDYTDTMEMSRMWGIDYKVVNIQPAVDAFLAVLLSHEEDPLERGNISSRCRMVVLYNRAKKMNYLVAGTSNKSELMTGYFTKFGDGACDFIPMADLYKTQVWQTAEMIGVPRNIIDKVPTAGLWAGQTDEADMGMAYCDLDMVLEHFVQGRGDAEISESTGLPVSKISEIRSRIEVMRHKRALPPHPGNVLESA